MKTMPNNKRDGHKVDTKVPSGNSGATTQEPIGLDEYQQYAENLRTISGVASKLFALIAEHISVVSSTAPVKRGYKTLNELKDQAKAHRDGLATAFDPLREQIESLKNNFWEKNREVIETTARKYVERRLKERVAIEVEQAIESYRDDLAKNEKDNEELKAIMDVSRARTENALLRSNRLDEQITWIGVEVPPTSFGELVHSSESRLLFLANSLDLSPGGEDSQTSLLNKVFHQLGIQYRGVPSRTGVLLIPTITNL